MVYQIHEHQMFNRNNSVIGCFAISRFKIEMGRNIAPKTQNLLNYEVISLYQELGTPFESCLRTFQKGFQQQSCSSGGNSFIQRHQQQFFPLCFSVCFCCCLLFYHAEFMTLFLILLGLKQNPGCRSNSGVKYSCDNPSTSTRHIVKCNQQADFSLFSAFLLGIFSLRF